MTEPGTATSSEQMNDAPHRREDDEDPPQYGEFFFFSLSACSRSAMAPHGGRVVGTISCDVLW
jgi:hypothetical protein